MRWHAGAVALLAEAGDWSTAIEWGRAWLARNGGHAAAADVALCVAVALCDQAESESSGRGDLEAAAAALQSAATLLRKYNCGSKLQADISSHLQVKHCTHASRYTLHARQWAHSGTSNDNP